MCLASKFRVSVPQTCVCAFGVPLVEESRALLVDFGVGVSVRGSFSDGQCAALSVYF